MHVIIVINKNKLTDSFVYAGSSKLRVFNALAREIEEQSGLSSYEAEQALSRDYVFVDALVNRI